MPAIEASSLRSAGDSLAQNAIAIGGEGYVPVDAWRERSKPRRYSARHGDDLRAQAAAVEPPVNVHWAAMPHANEVGRFLQPGDQLGIYGIVECLSEGGMGEVYKAHDEMLSRSHPGLMPGSRQRNVQGGHVAGMSSGFTLHCIAEGARDVHS